MARQINGSGRPERDEGDEGNDDDGKVASLDAARRRAAERARQEKRAARDAQAGGALTVRDVIIGLVVVAMAVGMIWHWVAPLVGATEVTR